MSSDATTHCPARPITSGPKHHWFGYYDKHQFDSTGRYVLGMEVGFEHRSPTADDFIRVGMIDLADGDAWTELGTSNAWCWQQGCMLQWLPGSETEVIWNDRMDGRFVCHVMDVTNGNCRTLGAPVYTLASAAAGGVDVDFAREEDARADGAKAIGLDFARTGWLRPGYGYAAADPTRDDPAPADSGIYRLDLATGEAETLLTIAQIAAFESPHYDPAGQFHWVNHLLLSPSGRRFVFLHRSRAVGGSGGFATRMFTAAADGSDLRLIDDHGGMSHFIWRDEKTILAWARRPACGSAFYLFDERTGEAEPVGLGQMTRNGHCSCLPAPHGDWVLNDTYPAGPDDRGQELYLYHVPTGRRVEIGRFVSPPEYTGEWRCDLHPRADRKGTRVCFDSPHAGSGRQMYVADITDLID